MLVIIGQGCEVSIKELDALLSLLIEKKRKMEQEEAERNMKILMEFLNCLKMQKVDELNEVCFLQFLMFPLNTFSSSLVALNDADFIFLFGIKYMC